MDRAALVGQDDILRLATAQFASPLCIQAKACATIGSLMKMLVTGGAGCIGSDLATELLARGDEVVVIDNLSSGNLEHIEPLRRNPRFRFVEGDLENPTTVQSVMDGIRIVYHLAANPDVKFSPGDATDKDLRQNVICTYNVLEAMRLTGVRRLAF